MECANCYIPNREIPDMDMSKLYAFLKRLPKRTYIRLIGAEPTMRNDLCDIIKNVKKHGHNCSLTTNGLKLGRLEYVQALKNASLRLVLISMNGAADDDVYKIIDSGKYANLKVRALRNCMLENMIINTGTIIAKGVNEHTIDEQINLFFNMMEETNYKPKVKPMLRFKSVGQIGRNMGEDHSYTIEELVEKFKQKFNIKKTNQPIKNSGSSIVYEYKNILIRFIDWTIDEDGVVDSENEYRGRITKDWKCAPFFEDVKLNEYGY
jgi:molybdenum cofactor biosynthesis enzyme MoaA